MNSEDKMAIINELINMRSKLLKTSLTMKLSGEDTVPLEQAEQALEDNIHALRSALHRDWHGAADEVLQEMKNASRRVQSRIRDIDRDIKRAEKVVEILGQVEELMLKIAPLLA